MRKWERHAGVMTRCAHVLKCGRVICMDCQSLGLLLSGRLSMRSSRCVLLVLAQFCTPGHVSNSGTADASSNDKPINVSCDTARP